MTILSPNSLSHKSYFTLLQPHIMLLLTGLTCSGHMWIVCIIKQSEWLSYFTLPSIFAQRSHNAFTTAASARCITPFSGPSLKQKKYKKY